MLTIREVINKSGLSSKVVYNYITSGKVQAERQGNKYLIPESELPKLPKPRNTTTKRAQAAAEKERFLQDVPFPFSTAHLESERLQVVKMITENLSKERELQQQIITMLQQQQQQRVTVLQQQLAAVN